MRTTGDYGMFQLKLVDGTVVDVCRKNNVMHFSINGIPLDSDQPIVFEDGSIRWIRNGMMDRDDGPAWIWQDWEQWFRRGIPHRSDGPAGMNKTGRYWFLDGMRIFSTREFIKKANVSPVDGAAMLLMYGEEL